MTSKPRRPMWPQRSVAELKLPTIQDDVQLTRRVLAATATSDFRQISFYVQPKGHAGTNWTFRLRSVTHNIEATLTPCSFDRQNRHHSLFVRAGRALQQRTGPYQLANNAFNFRSQFHGAPTEGFLTLMEGAAAAENAVYKNFQRL